MMQPYPEFADTCTMNLDPYLGIIQDKHLKVVINIVSIKDMLCILVLSLEVIIFKKKTLVSYWHSRINAMSFCNYEMKRDKKETQLP